MSTGQTGHTHQGVSRQNSLCLLIFFFPPILSEDKRKEGRGVGAQTKKPRVSKRVGASGPRTEGVGEGLLDGKKGSLRKGSFHWRNL